MRKWIGDQGEKNQPEKIKCFCPDGNDLLKRTSQQKENTIYYKYHGKSYCDIKAGLEIMRMNKYF